MLKLKLHISFFLLILIGTSMVCQAQKNITIEGTILDKKTQQTLPFCNIIVENAAIGTVSNENGFFELTLSDRYANSAIICSFVGYQNTKILISKCKGASKKIYLTEDTNSLEEIVITTKSKYKELITEAISLFPENYSQQPVYLDTYYRELTQIDQQYTKFSDAACTLYYAPYNDSLKVSKSRNEYMQFNHPVAQKKNIPFPEPASYYADYRDQANIIALRRSDNLQNYKVLSQSKTLHSIDTEDLKWLENNEIGGGPLRLTGADKVKRKADFFDPELHKHYRFSLLKHSTYNNRPVYIIAFQPKNDALLTTKYKGSITMDKESKAIIGYQYRLTSKAKQRLNRKYGTQLKTRPSLERKTKMKFISRVTELLNYEVFVTYSSFNGKWYLKRVKSINTYTNFGDFFETYPAITTSEFIVNAMHLQNVHPFPEPDIFYSTFSNALFDYELAYDPKFWKNYSIIVPTGVLGTALKDLEAKNSLEEQFTAKHNMQ